MGDEFFLPDDSHYWMSQMKGPMYLRLLPNAEHTTALSGLSTKHWVWTLRHTFLATMLDRKMPDYCVERYLKEDGTRGVKVIFLKNLFFLEHNSFRLCQTNGFEVLVLLLDTITFAIDEISDSFP